MTDVAGHRFADSELFRLRTDVDRLNADFEDHLEPERIQQKQSAEVHEALFRLEDKELGTPPGLLQLTQQLSARLRAIEIRDDRQRRFIGGIVFAVSSVTFVFSDTAHKLVDVLKRIFA